MRPRFGFFFIAAAVILSGCASSGGLAYNVIDVETTHDVLYTHRYKELVIVEGAIEHRSLIQSTTVMVHPRFSRDGSRIAWLDIGTATLGVSSTEVAAHVADVTKGPQQSFDTRAVSIERIGLDHKLMVEDAVPLVWQLDGSGFFVAHDAGVEWIPISGELRSVADVEGVRAMALAPGGAELAICTRSNLFSVGVDGGLLRPLLGDDFVPQFGNKQLRAVCFSPSGNELVFSLANEIYAMNRSSGEVTGLFGDRQDIYWMAWLPGTDELAYLAGRERHRGRTFASYQDIAGEFRLNVIGSDGSFQRELFRGHLMDVREAVPAMSPDGRFISVTSRPYPGDVYVIATDGSGVSQLTYDGPNSYSAWRARP